MLQPPPGMLHRQSPSNLIVPSALRFSFLTVSYQDLASLI